MSTEDENGTDIKVKDNSNHNQTKKKSSIKDIEFDSEDDIEKMEYSI